MQPWNDVQSIRTRAPLVHNITNYVVMNNTANALLALGASPVMAHAIEEMEEIAAIANALVINIGTLSAPWVESMLAAGRAAQKKGIPIVLDPVGAGASSLRTSVSRRLLDEIRPAIVRCNGSEVLSLALGESGTKGVDSTRRAEDTLEASQALARQYRCVVAVSGATDTIVDGATAIYVSNGHPMMTRVTGLGCTASALTGAFAAVNGSFLEAAAHAMAVNGIAGEIAAENSPGPGSLQVRFLDALYRLTESDIQQRLKTRSSDDARR